MDAAADVPGAGSGEVLVAVRSLSKYYTRGDQIIPVLVDINLDVGVADYIALMDPYILGTGRAVFSSGNQQGVRHG